MFIKIKAQSSDLEKQYIKERDIFKKKRKGPKLFLSALLVAAIGGYFYYLNSGKPLQSNSTSITSSEQKAAIAVENVQSQSDIDADNQSPLINQAVASEESKQAEETVEAAEQISNTDTPVESETTPLETTNDQEQLAVENLKNDTQTADTSTLEKATVSDDEDNSTQETQILTLEEDSSVEVDGDESVEAVTEQSLVDIAEPENEQEISQADIDEIEAEESLAENDGVVQTTDQLTDNDNIDSEQMDIELAASDTPVPNEELPSEELEEKIESDGDTELNAQTNASASEMLSDLSNGEQTMSTESAATVVDDESVATIEVENTDNQDIEKINLNSDQAQTLVNSEQTIAQGSGSKKQSSVEITEKSLTATDDTEKNVFAQDEAEQGTIKTISKIISNVFNRNDDGKELVADVIEIDFSKATDPEQGQEKVAVISVADSPEEQPYQGESIEELANTDDESTQVTIFEVSESEVREIVEQEKQNVAVVSNSENEQSIFEGVDSVSSADIPEVSKIKQTEQAIMDEAELNNNDNVDDDTNSSNEIVAVETIQVAKIETQPVGTNKVLSADDESKTTETTKNSAIKVNSNNSTITIKELYDQLMTDLDQKNSDTANTTANNNNGEKITIKDLYDQISQSNDNTDEIINNETLSATETKQAEIVSVESADQAETKVEVAIDPDKSLAMADQIDSDIRLNSVEEAVIIAETSTHSQAQDKVAKASINSNTSNQKVDSKGSTPLMIAALNSDLQSVRELVAQGAEINKRNDWGWTALLNATIKGNKPLVDYLLKNGASPHLADNDGRSPLMAAVLNNHPEIVKTLLNHKADVNKANRDGWTALSFAAWKGNTKAVKYLLDANAFKGHRTSEGLTPLQLAEQGGHTEIVRLLSL